MSKCRSFALAIVMTAALAGAASVTVDSPEKQRGGIIGPCHGAPDQEWPGAEGPPGCFSCDRDRAAT